MTRGLILSIALSFVSASAHATTGDGCWRPADGVVRLEIKALPSAGARTVATFEAASAPIIAGAANADAAEKRCRTGKGDALWCIVTIYDGAGPLNGFARRSHLRPSECP